MILAKPIANAVSELNLVPKPKPTTKTEKHLQHVNINVANNKHIVYVCYIVHRHDQNPT